MWVIVEYPGSDYTNPFGIPNAADTDHLAACFRYDLTVASEAPATIEVTAPNGGEVWEAGMAEEITWTSDGVTGTVFIHYSKDNFVGDIHTVATDEPNDGSYTWDPIPDDPSTTVRVKVGSTDIPAVNDVSDADFTIIEPQPHIWVLTPNGGEILEPGYGFPIPGFAAYCGNCGDRIFQGRLRVGHQRGCHC